MVLRHMLANSPEFLFAMSALLLGVYGIYRLARYVNARRERYIS